MKIIITLILGIYSSMAFSQVAIGKASVDEGAILDFGTAGDKGLVLPYVEDTNIETNAVAGTWYFDANESKVKFITDDGVKDMSVKGFSDTAKMFDKTQPFYNDYNETLPATAQGTIMGAETTTAPGVLILETNSKALALPVTADYKSIGDPAHGMVVYDSSIDKLCVFDGEKWAFWGRK